MEVARALKNHPQIRVRMGVHSGPVNQVTDVNDRLNVAGAGINFAQRGMDCADAGHILLSKRVADDLAQDRLWRPLLHELGEIEVKHGVKLGIMNLYNAELGNPRPPQRLSSQVSTAKEPLARTAMLFSGTSGTDIPGAAAKALILPMPALPESHLHLGKDRAPLPARPMRGSFAPSSNATRLRPNRRSSRWATIPAGTNPRFF